MVEIVKIPLGHEGKFIFDYISNRFGEELGESGLDEVLIRSFGTHRIGRVIVTGTDRDEDSLFREGGMEAIAKGLSEDEVIYCEQLRYEKRNFAIGPSTDSYSLYDGRKLQLLDIRSGLYCCKEGESFKNAILAVFLKEKTP